MSGHSKFANIKHKKEKNDAAKGKIFTILGREIAVAVKEGGPDPSNNSKLAQVIAKAKDEMMEKILKRVGADQVVFPEKESGIRLSHKLISEHLVDYFDLSDSTSLVEILPRAEWVGKNLRELNLRKEYKINVVAVIQNDEFNIAMDPDTPLKADEPLLIIMKKSDLKRFER